ncbi:hypothetical protein B7486_04065 [cyanobacterium TDX16]|nr:hypothetical protein B7486_04065 [cyanobacterium TDX16]
MPGAGGSRISGWTAVWSNEIRSDFDVEWQTVSLATTGVDDAGDRVGHRALRCVWDADAGRKSAGASRGLGIAGAGGADGRSRSGGAGGNGWRVAGLREWFGGGEDDCRR